MNFDEEFEIDEIIGHATKRLEQLTKMKQKIDSQLSTLSGVSGYEHIIGKRVSDLQINSTKFDESISKLTNGLEIVNTLKSCDHHKKTCLCEVFKMCELGKTSFLSKVADRVDEVNTTYESVMGDDNLTDNQRKEILNVYIQDLVPNSTL